MGYNTVMCSVKFAQYRVEKRSGYGERINNSSKLIGCQYCALVHSARRRLVGSISILVQRSRRCSNVFAYKIKLLAMAILDLRRRGATSLSLVLAINVLNGQKLVYGSHSYCAAVDFSGCLLCRTSKMGKKTVDTRSQAAGARKQEHDVRRPRDSR